MARQTVKPHRQEREVKQPQQRKSARISGAVEVIHGDVPKEVSSIQRPIRDAPNGKDAQIWKSVKVTRTASAAGVFKKKPKVNPRDKKHYRHREVREPTPEPGLLNYYRGMLLRS